MCIPSENQVKSNQAAASAIQYMRLPNEVTKVPLSPAKPA